MQIQSPVANESQPSLASKIEGFFKNIGHFAANSLNSLKGMLAHSKRDSALEQSAHQSALEKLAGEQPTHRSVLEENSDRLWHIGNEDARAISRSLKETMLYLKYSGLDKESDVMEIVDKIGDFITSSYLEFPESFDDLQSMSVYLESAASMTDQSDYLFESVKTNVLVFFEEIPGSREKLDEIKMMISLVQKPASREP